MAIKFHFVMSGIFLVLTIFLIASACAMPSAQISMKKSFSLNEEISFNFIIKSTQQESMQYIASYTCPSAPQELLEVKKAELGAGKMIKERKSVLKITEEIEPQICQAVVFIKTKEGEKKFTEDFEIKKEKPMKIEARLNKKVFLERETINLNYNVNYKDAYISIYMISPDRSRKKLSSPSFSANKAGTYSLEITASKKIGKQKIEKKQTLDFAVIKNNFAVQDHALESPIFSESAIQIYQENADETSFSYFGGEDNDPCRIGWGPYNPGEVCISNRSIVNINDGNWSSYAFPHSSWGITSGINGAEYYFSYTKPDSNYHPSFLKIKDYLGDANLSIPLECDLSGKVAFKARIEYRRAEGGKPSANITWYCKDSADNWKVLASNFECGQPAGTDRAQIYEEGMMWNVLNEQGICQENANRTLVRGSISCPNVFDGNWDTFVDFESCHAGFPPYSNFLIDYTIPPNALRESAYFKVKAGNSTGAEIFTYSIPEDAWNTTDENLTFLMYIHPADEHHPLPEVDMNYIIKNPILPGTIFGDGAPLGGYNPPGDANGEWISSPGEGYERIYEEAMCWNITGKNINQYSQKEVFIISDSDWHDVLQLVPISTWKESNSNINSICKKSNGTDSDICVYPTLIYHKENETSFDADSAIHFLQLYHPSNVTLVGATSQEFDNLLVASPELGAGLSPSQIQRVSPDSLLDYWHGYDSVIYSEDDYEISLLASTYASLKNIPLIIQGSSLDTDSNFAGRNIICIGSVSRACTQTYTLEELKQLYKSETSTNKLLLVNPNDLSINVSLPFIPDKSSNPIYSINTKNSLGAPFLASAKKELIISDESINGSDYSEVDNFVNQQIANFLTDISNSYLTIIATPNAVEYRIQEPDVMGYTNYRSADITEYADYNSDKIPDLSAGRIMGFSVSDSSSLIAESLFYLDIRNSRNMKFLASSFSYGILWTNRWAARFRAAGYNAINITSPDVFYEFNYTDYKNQLLISYIDHGSPSWSGIPYNQIPYLNSTMMMTDSCSNCAGYNDPNLFCQHSVRRGAVAYAGEATTSFTGNTIFYYTMHNMFYNRMDIGKSFKQNYFPGPGYEDAYPYWWMTMLIADPTFNPQPEFYLTGPLSTGSEIISEPKRTAEAEDKKVRSSMEKSKKQKAKKIKTSASLEPSKPVLQTVDKKNDMIILSSNQDSNSRIIRLN